MFKEWKYINIKSAPFTDLPGIRMSIGEKHEHKNVYIMTSPTHFLMATSPVLDFESIYILVLQLVDIATSAHANGDFALRDRTLERLGTLRRSYTQQRSAC